MMSTPKLVAILAVMTMFWRTDLYAQNEKDSEEVSFSFEMYRSSMITLPYRQAIITQNASPTKIAIYLHGGTSKGNDNITQMNEPGIDSIARYLSANNLSAVLIVPQCPATESWGGRLTDILKSLVEDRMNTFKDIKDVYIFGGSMGGTGTWTMISKYPGLFSAAMPVAGNPSKCDVSNVAHTPLFTVMGTDDRIMGMEAVTAFTAQLDEQGAKYLFEVEEGWSHEDTCIKSYTDSRLSWVFSNTKQPDDSGIIPIDANQKVVLETRYWTLAGVRVDKPTTGLYIVQEIYDDSSAKTTKVYIE